MALRLGGLARGLVENQSIRRSVSHIRALHPPSARYGGCKAALAGAPLENGSRSTCALFPAGGVVSSARRAFSGLPPCLNTCKPEGGAGGFPPAGCSRAFDGSCSARCAADGHTTAARRAPSPPISRPAASRRAYGSSPSKGKAGAASGRKEAHAEARKELGDDAPGAAGGFKAINFALNAPAVVVDRLVSEGGGFTAEVNGTIYDVRFVKRGAPDDVVHGLVDRLRDLRRQIAPLAARKRELDARAGASANRKIWGAFAYLVVQGLVVAKLTFFSRFGWDVMEPITYLLTFATAVGALGFFQFHRIEYSYPALFTLLSQRKQAKLFKADNFPEARYVQLEQDIRVMQARLRALLPTSELDALPDAGVVQPRWIKSIDEVSGMQYYYHTLTGESRLRRPLDFGLHLETFADSKTGAS